MKPKSKTIDVIGLFVGMAELNNQIKSLRTTLCLFAKQRRRNVPLLADLAFVEEALRPGQDALTKKSWDILDKARRKNN